ncbi:hypothetical protein [Nitratireductor soli]|uniref:hypothetical protein n=1 Tax=Nitratireductor soli TaxID=1670619 RepID=UPI00065DBD15|nr:hypothetical protein [Nitratireductor soli]
MAALPIHHFFQGIAASIYVATHKKRKTIMIGRRFMNGIGEFFGVVESAVAVSAAVRDRRRAKEADLKRLGIDPEQFYAMRRY